MRMWLKLKGLFSPEQYKESYSILEESETHKDMKIEFWDSRDNTIAYFHETTSTRTITEKE